MTISAGDKVVSIQTKNGPVAVYAQPVSPGDTVVSVKTSTGMVPIKVQPIDIGSKCVMVPDARGKYIAVATAGRPYRLMVPSKDASAHTWFSDDGLTWVAGADLGFAPTAFAWDDVNKIAYAAQTIGSDASQYSRIWKSVDYGVSWSSWTNAPGLVLRDTSMFVKSDGDILVLCAGYYTVVAKIAVINTTTGASTVKYETESPVEARRDWYTGMLVTETNRVIVCFSLNGGFNIRVITSDDFGETWTTHELAPPVPPFVAGSTYFRPNGLCNAGNGRILLPLTIDGYMSNDRGAYLSTDYGATWGAWNARTLPFYYGYRYEEVLFSPIPGVILGLFYVSSDGVMDLYRSTNCGVSWSRVTTSLDGRTMAWVSLPGRSIICYLNSVSSGNTNVIHSNDYGATWSNIPDGTHPTGGYCMLKMFL